MNPAAESDFHNAKETYKAKDFYKKYCIQDWHNWVISLIRLISLHFVSFHSTDLVSVEENQAAVFIMKMISDNDVYFIYLHEGDPQT